MSTLHLAPRDGHRPSVAGTLALISCQGMRAASDGYDTIPVAEIKEGVFEWLARNEPLSRAELNTIESTFIRTFVDPARVEGTLGGAGRTTVKNPHMRVASPEEFGIFAYEADVVLIELDETVRCGEMIGYPAGNNRWAPILFCLDGPVSEARDRMQFVVTTTGSVADGDLVL